MFNKPSKWLSVCLTKIHEDVHTPGPHGLKKLKTGTPFKRPENTNILMKGHYNLSKVAGSKKTRLLVAT